MSRECHQRLLIELMCTDALDRSEIDIFTCINICLILLERAPNLLETIGLRPERKRVNFEAFCIRNYL